MIRNAVIHMLSEQPLVADLFALPTATDAGLVCTNIRTLDGKRPVFIDRIDATFFFPYLHIRFIELPSTVDDGIGWTPSPAPPAEAPVPGQAADSAMLVPVPAGAMGDGLDGADDLEIELDEDFLRRIRDV